MLLKRLPPGYVKRTVQELRDHLLSSGADDRLDDVRGILGDPCDLAEEFHRTRLSLSVFGRRPLLSLTGLAFLLYFLKIALIFLAMQSIGGLYKALFISAVLPAEMGFVNFILACSPLLFNLMIVAGGCVISERMGLDYIWSMTACASVAVLSFCADMSFYISQQTVYTWLTIEMKLFRNSGVEPVHIALLLGTYITYVLISIFITKRRINAVDDILA